MHSRQAPATLGTKGAAAVPTPPTQQRRWQPGARTLGCRLMAVAIQAYSGCQFTNSVVCFTKSPRVWGVCKRARGAGSGERFECTHTHIHTHMIHTYTSHSAIPAAIPVMPCLPLPLPAAGTCIPGEEGAAHDGGRQAKPVLERKAVDGVAQRCSRDQVGAVRGRRQKWVREAAKCTGIACAVQRRTASAPWQSRHARPPDSGAPCPNACRDDSAAGSPLSAAAQPLNRASQEARPLPMASRVAALARYGLKRRLRSARWGCGPPAALSSPAAASTSLSAALPGADASAAAGALSAAVSALAAGPLSGASAGIGTSRAAATAASSVCTRRISWAVVGSTNSSARSRWERTDTARSGPETARRAL